MSDRRALIHCNAGPAYGMGHLMRCIAVAEEAAAQDWVVRFGGDLSARALDVLHERLGEIVVDLRPREYVGRWLRSTAHDWAPTVIHVDSYWLSSGDVPRTGGVVSTVQDGAFGIIAADITVDGNLHAEQRVGPLLQSRHYLLGSSAALVRRQVRQQRQRAVPSGTASVLVVLGGTDEQGLTATVVGALDSLESPFDLTVIAPPKQLSAVRALAARSTRRIETLSFAHDLPSLAAAHHFVVSAAGTSVWDFACMGIPMALIAVVDNQRESYWAAVNSGLAIGLGLARCDNLDAGVQELAAALSNPATLADLAKRGLATIDGLGAWRLVSAWEQLSTERMAPLVSPISSLAARRATMEDAEVLFLWRNDLSTREASRSHTEIAWDSHVAWMTATLQRTDRLLLVVEQAGQPIGTVRWDHRSEEGWEASITLAPEARGRRLGIAVLRAGEAALHLPEAARLLAVIHEDNEASCRLFKSAGYFPYLPPDHEGFLTLSRWLLTDATDASSTLRQS